MQLELSNFQPLAANDEEAPDLGGAEQLSEPMIEESDQGLEARAFRRWRLIQPSMRRRADAVASPIDPLNWDTVGLRSTLSGYEMRSVHSCRPRPAQITNSTPS